MAALESEFQHRLIKELEVMFPECVVLKNDSGYKKNIPDLSVFYNDHYAFLEVKRSYRDYISSRGEPGRKNQEWYVNKFDAWSFAAFIYPENKDEVLKRLERYFKEGLKDE